MKYVVIEMQNGVIGGNTWAYDDRPSAEVKLYQVLSEVVKSPVEVHSVMLVTDEGFVLDSKCYKHPAQPSEGDSGGDEDESDQESQATDESLSEPLSELESMTKAELIQYASDHGVSVSQSWTKAEIIAVIQGAV